MPQIREIIIDRLDSLSNLPSLSESAREVQKVLSRPESTASTGAAEIGKIIEADLGMSAKILKFANSAHYTGRYGRIGDLNQAIARLGVDEVGRICTTFSCMELFADTAGIVELKEFWKHSISVAIATRYLAGISPCASSIKPDAYVAGLFHDIGILILDSYFTEVFRTVFETGKQKAIPLYEAEGRILGLNHGEIGAYLCRKWGLPEEIYSAIACHHKPDSCSDSCRILSQLIHLANFTCAALDIPEPGDGAIQHGSNGAWHDLGLDGCDLNKLAGEIEEGIVLSGVFISLSL